MHHQKWFWIRIIQKYIGKIEDVDETWQIVIEKAPTNILKQLAISVANVSEMYNLKYYTGCPHLYRLVQTQ